MLKEAISPVRQNQHLQFACTEDLNLTIAQTLYLLQFVQHLDGLLRFYFCVQHLVEL